VLNSSDTIPGIHMSEVQEKKPASLRDTLVTALAPAVWGSTYVVTTELLPPDHPLTAAAIRALPAGLFMLALTRTLPKGHWWRLIILSLLNIGVFQALLFVGAYRLPGGVAATVGAVQPLVVVLISWAILHERHSWQTWLAAIGGLIGVALLVLGPAAKLDAIGIAAALTGAVAMACGIVLTKRWKLPMPPAALTAWQLTIGGAFLLPLAIAFEEPIRTVTMNNMLGFAYLAIVGGAITHAIWFRGMVRLPTSSVSILMLLSPVVATFLGFVLLHQHLTVLQMFGSALVLGSVWMGQRQGRTAVVSQLARR
jgi:probable blue pigment (indigoidine) exporter